MPVVVQKYGGSSVADVAKLAGVADRVVATRQTGADVVVVVSAMGKTTDGLLALAREVAGVDGGDISPPRRELDMLVSTGERVSMALMSIAIQARGLDAISFTGSQSGIITNDRHFDARIIEVRPHRIEDELARGRVVIVAGYQGMSYKREITTLGRGGTDTTAVALAAALEAERCEIYSDVDGVYSADPRTVATAKHLPELSYELLQEMAESGAQVVCAQAAEWARNNGVALFARAATNQTEPPRQTIVRKDAPAASVRARAVTAAPDVAVVRCSTALPTATLSPMLLRKSEGITTLVISKSNVPDWATQRDEITAAGARLQDDVAMVSVVGSALNEQLEAVDTFTQALGTEAYLLDATALRISAVIAKDHLAEAQQSLHHAFVDTVR